MTHCSDTTLATEGQPSITETNATHVGDAPEQSDASQRLIYQHLSHGRRADKDLGGDTA